MRHLWIQAGAAVPAALIPADHGQDVAPLLARLAGALWALARRPAGVLLLISAAAGAGAVAADLLQRSLLPSHGSAMPVRSRTGLLLWGICTGKRTLQPQEGRRRFAPFCHTLTSCALSEYDGHAVRGCKLLTGSDTCAAHQRLRYR